NTLVSNQRSAERASRRGLAIRSGHQSVTAVAPSKVRAFGTVMLKLWPVWAEIMPESCHPPKAWPSTPRLRKGISHTAAVTKRWRRSKFALPLADEKLLELCNPPPAEPNCSAMLSSEWLQV